MKLTENDWIKLIDKQIIQASFSSSSISAELKISGVDLGIVNTATVGHSHNKHQIYASNQAVVQNLKVNYEVIMPARHHSHKKNKNHHCKDDDQYNSKIKRSFCGDYFKFNHLLQSGLSPKKVV